jgi:hypothetical protein
MKKGMSCFGLRNTERFPETSVTLSMVRWFNDRQDRSWMVGGFCPGILTNVCNKPINPSMGPNTDGSHSAHGEGLVWLFF